MNNFVVYDVIQAEKKILVRDNARRAQMLEAMRTGKKESRLGNRFQQFATALRTPKAESVEQSEFREQLAGC